MKKIVVISSVICFAVAAAVFLCLGEKTKHEEINILISDENYNVMRGIVAEYEEKNNVKINLMKDSFFGDTDKLANLIYTGEENKKTGDMPVFYAF